MTVANRLDFATEEARQFNRLFIVVFVLFLPVALIARLLPRSWRPWDLAGETSMSVIAEAKAAAGTFIPFAFMG